MYIYVICIQGVGSTGASPMCMAMAETSNVKRRANALVSPEPDVR